MSELSFKDLRLWVKEELQDAICQRQKELNDDPDQTFDERVALDREVKRLLKFLGFK